MPHIKLTTLLTSLAFLTSRVTAHNLVYCSNFVPNATAWELSLQDPQQYAYNYSDPSGCKGYERAAPPENDPGNYFRDNWNDQAYPWQGIWPTVDHTATDTHRAVNWVQANPDYTPGRPPARVKPGATILVQTYTNNHASEWVIRTSGHYKVYLAGPSGTQITTLNQLTDDRCIFKAPENKYSHITKNPDGTENDPHSVSFPLKMIDATGAYLPAGTYNFVWTWWWQTLPQSGTKEIPLLPSYSSSFDIVIDAASDDAGFVTPLIAKLGDEGASAHLVGNCTAPGCLDTHSPFAPFTDGYLTREYNGDTTDKRTFQPYWTQFTPATAAPAMRLDVNPPHVKDMTDAMLQAPIDYPPGSKYPNGTALTDNAYGWSGYEKGPDGGAPALAIDAPSQQVTEILNPMRIDGSQAVAPAAGGNSTMGYNSTMPTNSTMGSNSGSTGGSVGGSMGGTDTSGTATTPTTDISSSTPSSTPMSTAVVTASGATTPAGSDAGTVDAQGQMGGTGSGNTTTPTSTQPGKKACRRRRRARRKSL